MEKKKTRKKSSSFFGKGPKRIPRILINGKRKEDKIPPLKKNDIRIIPIGGVEEVGKNMTAIEHDNDILIIDCGFQFKEEDTPGIDFILPNTKYLEKRKGKIRAMLITHGHLDHIGGVPYLMEKLGNPPIYTRQFGALQILKRQEEFPHLPDLDIKVVKGTEKIKFGSLSTKFFPVDHSIPDSMGIIVETPHGDIVMTGDLKLDSFNGVPTKEEEETYSIFKNRKILLLTLDSTNVERAGFSLSESIVIENIREIMEKVKGRLIIAAFASQIDRLLAFIEFANKYNKKIVVEGRSMKTNIEIVKKLGLIKSLKDIISVKEMDNYPPDKILVLSTGGQGEDYSALVRMANKTHRHIKLNKNDTVLMSASIIPGNERAIAKLKDNVYRHVNNVITYLDSDVHASGHAYRGEMKWVHKRIPYKFFMPVHGHHYMLKMHANLARTLGVKDENIIVPDNGSIIEIQNKGQKIIRLKEKAPSSTIMVDGFAIGDTQEMVIRDRKVLAEDGIFLIVASIDPRTGVLRKSPDIIARGFVYLKESQELLGQTRLIIKKSIETNTKGMSPINFDFIKDALTDDVRRFLFQKTAKSPMVIPVIIGI
jgi:ribonuclease J